MSNIFENKKVKTDTVELNTNNAAKKSDVAKEEISLPSNDRKAQLDKILSKIFCHNTEGNSGEMPITSKVIAGLHNRNKPGASRGLDSLYFKFCSFTQCED